jgi:hypothetical protein
MKTTTTTTKPKPAATAAQRQADAVAIHRENVAHHSQGRILAVVFALGALLSLVSVVAVVGASAWLLVAAPASLAAIKLARP